MIKKFALLVAVAIGFTTANAQTKMTPELLWKLGRLSGNEVSPDGQTILYGVAHYDVDSNKGTRQLFSVPYDGGAPKQLTHDTLSKSSEHWRPDGKRIGYLAATSEGNQLFEMDPDGGKVEQLTHIPGGIDNFSYAPDMKHISYTRDIKTSEDTQDKYPNLPKANVRIITDLLYRHWDVWTGHKSSHLFVAEYKNGKVGDSKDLLKGEPYDTPMKPFGGPDQIAWSPDGNSIAYTCKKLTGKAYSESTNSDIYLYNLKSGTTQDLSDGMPGYDMVPVFSPSGKYLLWESMEHAGFESDRTRLIRYNFDTKQKDEITKGLDRDALSPVWSKDEKKIYFISGQEATYQIFSMDLMNNDSITQITSGDYDYNSVTLVNNYFLVGQRTDMNHPADLFLINIPKKSDNQLTFVNNDVYKKINIGNIDSRWIKTTDGKKEKVWIIYPPQFDPSKKYPALLYCQGGPQDAVSQFFSYRWNFQLMAAEGYIIIAPNRRGLPSFGRKWNNEISRDWGGQAMKDYMSAVDSMSKFPYIDTSRIGAVGASFGGYSVFWLAGHNLDKKFKCFIAHDGVFNLRSFYLTTDEMWFANWDLGSPFDPKNQEDYKKFSPINFVKNWNTPILIVQGAHDYRITPDQGEQAFQAAQLMGIPSKLLYFNDECHWVLAPQDGLVWQHEFFGWLDKWLQPK